MSKVADVSEPASVTGTSDRGPIGGRAAKTSTATRRTKRR